MSSPHIFLIGPMGAGKTAVGRRLARELKLPFIDTDMAIQERTGVDIAFIFEKEGEAGFRQREMRMLEELAKGEPSVIATGGGIVELDENLERLRNSACTVFLDASVAWQYERTHLGKGKNKGLRRPLLDTSDPQAILHSLYERRRPRYTSCASLVVETDDRHVGDVTEEILRRLNAGEIQE